MPRLEIVDGPEKGKVFAIQREETVIGRVAYCDVVLSQKNISRQHARVVRSGSDFFLEDMDSTNGTFLNGKRVRARTRLRDHDLVRIYDVTLLFRETAEPEEPRGRESVGATDGEFGEPAPGMTTETVSPASASTDGLRRNVGVNAYEKLKTVLQINRTLGSSLNIDLVLPKILDSLITVFPQTDRAYILFPDEETGELRVRAEKRKDEGTLITSSLGPISQTIANRVLSRGEAILNADGLDDDQFRVSDSVLDFPIRSMMCAPLIGPMQKPLGIIYVDTNDPYERFHEDDLEVLLSLAATAGQAVEYARSHETQLRMDRRQRELATAKQVQLHFLPQSRPYVAGYRFFEFYNSAEEIGGDLYGYLPLPDGRLAITLGDVSGKGITAALIMARLCSEVRYRLVSAATPWDAVHDLNREFSRPENEAWFVTFVLCVLDAQRHEAMLVNAGHMPPILRRFTTGEVSEVGDDVAGPPLGCDATIRYQPFRVQFEPGDALLMYTDGINEAMDPDRTVYGSRRVRKTLQGGPKLIDELCLYLLADVKRYTENQPQADDICMVAIQRE
ncbi:MAG: SpoIIE family protein phosphatase [Pirellulaceae bacterium]|jgi:serine phosphatase RsbU (regulator of sigma subunit)/pSer/pThr/pTyr-binding forkhead associated (FHA) protein|nr:SpoIIE family protein phosphatase [Pirellulaceae bacterium]